MTPNYEIRRRARDTLGGNIFSGEWLFGLLICLIISAVSSVAAIVYIIIYGPLMMGSSSYFINRVRRTAAHDTLDPLFDGFRGSIGDNIIIGLLISAFTALWTLLFIIPGIVKACSYSMAYYIKCDDSTLSATDAIRMSEVMMRGHKWRYFCLQFSFIGWIIVGALAFGIGTLWVAPYMAAANAEFYEDLKNQAPVVTP